MQRVTPLKFIDSIPLAEKLLKDLLKYQGIIGLDTETTGLAINSKVILWSMATSEERYCLTKSTLQTFAPLLTDKRRVWALTNPKYDLHILANEGIFVEGRLFDTITLDSLLDQNRGHGLKECARDYLDLPLPEFKEVFRLKRGETTETAILRAMDEDLPKALQYASLDAYASLTLVTNVYYPKLSKIKCKDYPTLWDYYLHVEEPIARILFWMERLGIRMDIDYLKSLEEPMQDKIEAIEKELTRFAGYTINLKSPIQLSSFLINRVGLDSVKQTKKGAVSTDAESLELWLEQYKGTDKEPIISALLEHRELTKILNTYVIGLQKHAETLGDNRIHTTFNQAGARTGRFSSSNPNLQNLPNPGNDDFKIRRAFIPEPGNILLDPDYDQLEMKVMAHMSGDTFMIKGITEGLDMHCLCASQMYRDASYEAYIAAKKTDDAHKTAEMHDLTKKRSSAKTIGFGLLYGQGAIGLAKRLHCTPEEAQTLIDAYFAALPGVHRYMQQTIESCYEKGYVRTLMGRYRYLPAILSPDYSKRKEAERQAVNTTIQGSAADIVKMAMIKVASSPILRDINCWLLLQIHDELMFEMPNDPYLIDIAKQEIQKLMEHPLPYELAVPLTVTVTSGFNWIEAKG